MFVPGTTSRPPEDLVVPYNEQLIFTILTHLPFFFTLYKATTNIITRGDATCLLFTLGGFISSIFEPIIDVTGFCFFPSNGHTIAYTAFGRPIPLFVPATYGWFVGGLGYNVLCAMRSGHMTRGGLWRLWLRNFVANLVLEYPAIYTGMYVYYGFHPFQIAGFPLWFPACHALAPLVSATLVYVLQDRLVGWRKVFVVPIVTSTYGMANIGAGWPVWIALSLDKGMHVSWPAGFAAFGLIGTSIWVLSNAFPEDSPIVQNGYARTKSA